MTGVSLRAGHFITLPSYSEPVTIAAQYLTDVQQSKLLIRSCLIDDGGGTDKELALAASSNPSRTPLPSACPGVGKLAHGRIVMDLRPLGPALERIV